MQAPGTSGGTAVRSRGTGTAVRIGAVAWLLVPLYLVAEFVAIGAVWSTGPAPHDPLRNVISDLGAAGCTTIPYPYGDVPVCSPASGLLNAAFIVTGLLMVLGAVCTARALRPGRAHTVGVALWVLVGLACMGSAVPLDVDLSLHTLLSLPMVLQGPAVWFTASGLRDRMPRLAAVGRVVAVVAVVASLTMLAVSVSGWFIGLWQRLSVWPGYLWLGAVGWSLLTVRPSR